MEVRRGRSRYVFLGAATVALAVPISVCAAFASPAWKAVAPLSPDPSTAHDGWTRPQQPYLLVQGHGQPVLNVSRIILAEPASETPLPIQVGPADAIARNSFIRIRGLPPAAALTEGHSIAPGAWAIPIISLPNLKITVPVGQSGKSDVTVALVTVDGTVVAEAKTALVVAAASLIAPGDSKPESKSVASLGPTSSGEPAARSQDTRSGQPETPQETEEHKRAVALKEKGDQQLVLGDVASARLFFERAAEAGLATAALALASTYDPDELARLGALTVQPDPKEARKWYERARQLGAAEADERLRRLGARE